MVIMKWEVPLFLAPSIGPLCSYVCTHLVGKKEVVGSSGDKIQSNNPVAWPLALISPTLLQHHLRDSVGVML